MDEPTLRAAAIMSPMLISVLLMALSIFFPRWGILKRGDVPKKLGDLIAGGTGVPGAIRNFAGFGVHFAGVITKDLLYHVGVGATYIGILGDSNDGFTQVGFLTSGKCGFCV